MSRVPPQNGNSNSGDSTPTTNPGPGSGPSTSINGAAAAAGTSNSSNHSQPPNPHSRYAPYTSHPYKYYNDAGSSINNSTFREGYRGGPSASSSSGPGMTRYYHRPRYQSQYHSSYRPPYRGAGANFGSGPGSGPGPVPTGGSYYYNRYRGRHYSSYESRQRERIQQPWGMGTGVDEGAGTRVRSVSGRFGRDSPVDTGAGYMDRMRQSRVPSSTSPYGSRSLPSSSASSPSPMMNSQVQAQSQPVQQVQPQQQQSQTLAQQQQQVYPPQPPIPSRTHSRSPLVGTATSTVLANKTPPRPLTPKVSSKFDMRESPFLYLTGLHKLKGKENSEYEEIKTVLKEGDTIDDKLSKEKLKRVMNEVELALLSNQCEKDTLNVQLTQDNLDSLLLMQDT